MAGVADSPFNVPARFAQDISIYPARALSPEEHREIVEAQADCFGVIRDRVFTAADVKALNLENRWSDAVQHHQQTLDAPKLGKAYDSIRLEILGIATRTR